MLASTPPAMLTDLLSHYATTPAPGPYPRVTLTFAQSLDAKIAGRNGKQLILSGKESMIYDPLVCPPPSNPRQSAHIPRMRTMHDAILVGIGTALNDDPQLNTRHIPPPPPGTQPHHLPRPVILDSVLRLSPNCKLLVNYKNGTGRRPWVICASNPASVDDPQWNIRLEALEKAGARIVQVPVLFSVLKDEQSGGTSGTLPIPAILEALYTLGVRNLMVEGGARVIGSFFSAKGASGDSVIHSVIVTVTPTFVGDGGVGYELELGNKAQGFEYVRTEMMGRDTVVALAATRLA